MGKNINEQSWGKNSVFVDLEVIEFMQRIVIVIDSVEE
jgi:hypothetical protein